MRLVSATVPSAQTSADGIFAAQLEEAIQQQRDVQAYVRYVVLEYLKSEQVCDDVMHACVMLHHHIPSYMCMYILVTWYRMRMNRTHVARPCNTP